jgi:2'-5' RNA ligase
VQNYHITTAFIGEVDDRALQKLSQVLEGLKQPCFELELNDVGYWSDSGVLWVGPTCVPDGLSRLQRECRKAANRIGARGGGRRYQPHLTLARNLTVPPASGLVDPDFLITVNELQLWSSTRHAHGANYQVLGTWRLG